MAGTVRDGRDGTLPPRRPRGLPARARHLPRAPDLRPPSYPRSGDRGSRARRRCSASRVATRAGVDGANREDVVAKAPVVVYRPINRNDSFTVTSNRRKLLYVAVPVIR